MSSLLLLISVLSAIAQSQVPPTSTTNESEVFTNMYHGSATTFANQVIICTKPICLVTCNLMYGCSGTKINASLSDKLTLNCEAEESCYGMTIINGGQLSTDIDCTNKSSCAGARFNVGNSANVDLNCPYEAVFSNNSPCDSAQLNAITSTNVSVNCEYNGCKGLGVHAENVTNKLDVRCVDSYACDSAGIYCPEKRGSDCNIQCFHPASLSSYYSCKNLAVYVKDESFVDQLTLNCWFPNSIYSCNGASVYCGDYSWIAPSSDLKYKEWGYTCETHGCCPYYYGYLNCNTSICVIDCVTRDCRNYKIDGSLANVSLTVNCNAINGGCGAAIIGCPVNTTSSCIVNCYGDNACNMISISGTDAYSLHLDCIGSESCIYANVYCPNDAIGVCNIDCSSNDYHMCNYLDIYSSDDYVYDYLSLICPNSTNNPNDPCYAIWARCDTKTDVSVRFYNGEPDIGCYSNYRNDPQYCCPWYYGTYSPTTSEPTSNPITFTPTTTNPTTSQPTTAMPTTSIPTISPLIPTTNVPTTFEPTTAVPTTFEPTTITPTFVPTTSIPTTAVPTTSIPTKSPLGAGETHSPTTDVPTFTPTTAIPTQQTSNPSTVVPTQQTENPTTDNPSTAKPTLTPIQTTILTTDSTDIGDGNEGNEKASISTLILNTSKPWIWIIIAGGIILILILMLLIIFCKQRKKTGLKANTMQIEMSNSPPSMDTKTNKSGEHKETETMELADEIVQMVGVDNAADDELL